jgi:hypothetical protein
MIIKRFFKVNSYEKIIFNLKFYFYYAKFRAFRNILYEFTYLEPELGHRLWLRNTGHNIPYF